MTADELRAIMSYLRDNVHLETESPDEPVRIMFERPDRDTMIADGLNPAGTDLVLSAPWYEDMITDIVETPDFCEPDDSPDQILEYARDVVTDTLRKRVPLG
ncbi:hypothetical protein JCM14469_05750 [Desulfatiferula olefinivorans]